MDDSIKKEKSEINQNDVKNLLEYKPSSKPKIQVADDRGDGEYFGNIIMDSKKFYNEQSLYRDDYPWEDQSLFEKDIEEQELNEIIFYHGDDEKPYIAETKRMDRRGAKIKGSEGKFEKYEHSIPESKPQSQKTLFGRTSPLQASPPSNPADKARAIAEVKNDPYYKIKNSSGFSWEDRVEILGGDQWLGALHDVAAECGFRVIDMLYAMAKESRLVHNVWCNCSTRASGLFQLTRGTASDKKYMIKTSTDLAEMNPFEQLKLLRQFMLSRKNKDNLLKLYTSIIIGHSIGKNEIASGWQYGGVNANANKSVDVEKNDGGIKGWEIEESAKKAWRGGYKPWPEKKIWKGNSANEIIEKRTQNLSDEDFIYKINPFTIKFFSFGYGSLWDVKELIEGASQKFGTKNAINLSFFDYKSKNLNLPDRWVPPYKDDQFNEYKWKTGDGGISNLLWIDSNGIHIDSFSYLDSETKQRKLKQIPTNAKYIVSATPIAIINGNAQNVSNTGRSGDRTQRTAVGILSDGNAVIYVCQSKTLREARDSMLKIDGIKDAIFLDGGTSTFLMKNDKFLIKPRRKLPNILVW